MVAGTQRWWLQGEAQPRLSLGEQENIDIIREDKATPAWITGAGGGLRLGGCGCLAMGVPDRFGGMEKQETKKYIYKREENSES